MPDKATFLKLMKDASAFSDEYRSTNIDPAHRRADNAYHGILENEADYIARKRSSMFIPKTRINCGKWTRVIAEAYFASDDVVTLTNVLEPDGARFTNEVVNIRLEKHMPTFMFIAKAAHAHVKYGNAVGKTGWEFQTQSVTEEGADGAKTTYEAPHIDRPFFELVPFENIEYDFRIISEDPVQDSPFWREWIPMYLTDVEYKFKTKEWKKPKAQDWKTIKINASTETVRKARQGKMTDPQAQNFGSDGNESAYHIIWGVNNFFRISGTDWNFLSIGNEYIVTDPERTVDKHVHHRRPYALSQFDPEAFRSYSDGLPEMMRHLQAEANAIRNERRDNVAGIIHRGYFVDRAANVQLQSLMSPRPNMVTLTDNIEGLKAMDAMDVTASAYREEDVTARDIEEISGHSQNMLGVQGSDRQSATEAAIKASASGEKEAFIIKSFNDTFMRPLLTMLVANIVAMENDQDVLNDAALATGLYPDTPLVDCEVVINAGMGSTNKELQSMRIGTALDRATQLAGADPEFLQAAKELFRDLLPLMGRKNVDRYLPRVNAQAAPVPSNAGGTNPAAPSPPGPAASTAAPGMSPSAPQGNLGGFASGMLQ